MKIALVIVMGMIAGACTQSAKTTTAADEQAIRDLIRQTEAMNNSSDSLGWVSLFEDGAVYMGPGAPEVTTATGLRETAFGDWAFARSRVTGTATPRTGGNAIRVDLKQLVIYRRLPDGSWKIARFISNSNS